jgi:carboxypeptidase Taq
MEVAYEELRARLREAGTLASVAGLLSWDQETMMPVRAADFRAEQTALLARLAHERACGPRIEELIAACEADPALADDEIAAANLREIRRDFDRRSKLPPELVAEISETSSRALEAWRVAREGNDFAAFRPWLERQLELGRRKAECYGAPEGGELYDALLQDFEPQMTAAELETFFRPLRVELTRLIAEIDGTGHRPDRPAQRVEIAIERQRAFSRHVLERFGFDLGAGRLDVSTHPFSTGIADGDTRLTTRYTEQRFADALSSTMHEAGHALYEQGLPKREHFGTPLAEAVGLGIHESQSRLWENHVGRSRAFWEWALPEAERTLGPALARFSPEDVYREVNTVEPNLIRVDSDEATYNLHVMLRFDLERAMLRGDLPVADLPEAWNRRIREDLGLQVPDDARGCLQDIHWSMGSVGYFPTYTLGTLYAAQFWEAPAAEIPDIDGRMARGDFAALLGWLREKIHGHGRRFSAGDLCRRITGAPLSHGALMRHLEGKLRGIYG